MTDPKDEYMDQVEEYIRGLGWAADTPADVVSLVAGNIRGFAGWARRELVAEHVKLLEELKSLDGRPDFYEHGWDDAIELGTEAIRKGGNG